MITAIHTANQGDVDEFIELNEQLDREIDTQQYYHLGLMSSATLCTLYHQSLRSFCKLPLIEQKNIVNKGIQGYAYLLEGSV